MSFFKELFNCCQRPSYNSKSDVMVNSGNILSTQANSPQKRIMNQSTISGLTCDSTLIKATTLGKLSTIFPKTKKPSCDSSAIFTDLPSLLKPYEDPNYIPSNCIITEVERQKAKEILLKNTDGHLLSKASITIDASGIKGISSRKDCITYFWFDHDTKTSDSLTKNNKDVILSYQNDTANSDYAFMIFYIKELEQYKIKINPSYTKELYEHLYFSIAKNEQVPLNTKEYIFFDDLQFQITQKSNGVIEIINFDNSKKYIFSSMQLSKITIGKSEDCTISFPNKSNLCDIHLVLTFKRQWMITDLSSQENQCWMYSDSLYKITNDFIIKIDDSSMMITI